MMKDREIGQITIILNDRSFEYDVYTLLLAYFPGREIQVRDASAEGDEKAEEQPNGQISDTELLVSVLLKAPDERTAGLLSLRCGEISRTIPLDPGSSRSLIKNRIKRSLYEALRDLSGQSLPWGNLTGIRPVRLAMEELEKAGDRETASKSLQAVYYLSPRKAALSVETAEKERDILGKLHPEEGYSLYIGIPFCPSICLYCSFSSGPISLYEKEVDRYLDALIYEMEETRDLFAPKKLQSIYIGGGTPTTLSPERLQRLLEAVSRNFDLSAVREFTCEAGRPDSIDREKLSVLKDFGISRISINPQTMNQKTLDLIGRRHTVEETVSAFALARSMGFSDINMDLIVGLPGEGLLEVHKTLESLATLAPEAITVHALALKRAARLSLHLDEYERISFQASDQIMDACEETCRGLGMGPYYLYRQKNMAGNFENVGWSLPGFEGLYNILIMEEVQSILALGASASTKFVWEGGRIERAENVKDVRNYLDRIDEMIRRKWDLKEKGPRER